jgi:hypothetical protein
MPQVSKRQEILEYLRTICLPKDQTVGGLQL